MDKFDVREYRFDKKKPNTQYVIDSIRCIIKYDWTKEINYEKTYYYGENKKHITNMKIIKMLNMHNNITIDQIIQFNPISNKKWLDLGCGSGKMVNTIKKYNPSYYVGLDADIIQLVRALKYHDMMQDVYIFNPCNLNKDWKENDITWYSMDKILDKFDYIVANFSLMHFFNDNFWSNLNKVVCSGTIFLFNLVNTNVSTMEWKENESFMKVNNNKVSYYFEWTHNMIMEENHISNNMLQEYMSRYDWTIKSKYNNNMYEWFVIMKN
jgi:SAM-dependent methyltransferase